MRESFLNARWVDNGLLDKQHYRKRIIIVHEPYHSHIIPFHMTTNYDIIVIGGGIRRMRSIESSRHNGFQSVANHYGYDQIRQYVM